jgi:hypothetical protein
MQQAGDDEERRRRNSGRRGWIASKRGGLVTRFRSAIGHHRPQMRCDRGLARSGGGLTRSAQSGQQD